MLINNASLLQELNKFHEAATKATYASNSGVEILSQREGFRELEHRNGDWYYRDSYTGFLRSWGQEAIYYQDKPFWTCLYGGGMEQNKMDQAFAMETFGFLKKALSSGKKTSEFLPRGPSEFIHETWCYKCTIQGNITNFEGREIILFQNTPIFRHHFFGGLVVL